MDVDSVDSVTSAINSTLQHGPIDILVNNAGIERMGSVEELPLADFRAHMDTNYFGVIRCTPALIPHLRERRSGRILNVSSAAYASLQWALEGMTEALAGELKLFNIRIALIQPGIIDTSTAQNIGAPGSPSIYSPPRPLLGDVQRHASKRRATRSAQTRCPFSIGAPR